MKGIRKESRERRVAFVGLFGAGNHGNDVSLSAAIAQFHRVDPDLKPVVVCASPENVSAVHHVDTTPIVRGRRFLGNQPAPLRLLLWPLVEVVQWLATMRTVRRVDITVVPGTGILDDFGCGPLTMPYDLFRWTTASWLLRRPVHFVSVGAGPVVHPVSRWLFRAAASRAASCSFRDDVSLEYMRSIGRRVASDRVVPDLAFCLSQSHDPPSKNGSVPVRVGLGVMAYFGWTNDEEIGRSTFESYLSKLVEFLGAMFERGHIVHLLVGDNNDAQAVLQLTRMAEARFGSSTVSKHLEISSITSFGELIDETDRTDVVVATRYHNVIGALISGRPVVSIGYAQKNRDVLRQVGLERYCQDVEDFDVVRMIADTDTLVQRRHVVTPLVTAAVTALGRKAADQFDDIASGKSGVPEVAPW